MSTSFPSDSHFFPAKVNIFVFPVHGGPTRHTIGSSSNSFIPGYRVNRSKKSPVMDTAWSRVLGNMWGFESKKTESVDVVAGPQNLKKKIIKKNCFKK